DARLSPPPAGQAVAGAESRIASRATGAQRKENCGLIASARRNHDLAEGEPRQRSIIARWKTRSASRVPSRSARTEGGLAAPPEPWRTSPSQVTYAGIGSTATARRRRAIASR